MKTTTPIIRRMEFEKTPIYVDPNSPDWFVPTQKGDFLLKLILENFSKEKILTRYSEYFNINITEALMDYETIFKMIPQKIQPEYTGRGKLKTLNKITECWFHLTNKCNLECTYCMFPTGPSVTESIDPKILQKNISSLLHNGCLLFYFTGGEPFIYDGFTSIVEEILEHPHAHVVILTNGKNIKKFEQWLLTIPLKRIHFQVSVDGIGKNHDLLRGEGEFDRLSNSLAFLQKINADVTLSMSVNRKNLSEMSLIPSFAKAHGVKNIHFMWFFIKGRGDKELFVPPDKLFEGLRKSYELSIPLGVTIDNIEILRSQVFSIPGTKHDLSGSGWNSVAVDPKGDIYPSPALIGEDGANGGNIKNNGIHSVWRESPLLNKLRNSSVIDDPNFNKSGLGFITGGSDIDHSYITTGKFSGGDPYGELYEKLVLYLIHEKSQNQGESSGLFINRMGEYVCECDEESSDVALTHSNCVLSIGGKDGWTSSAAFYSNAAKSINYDILNPVELDPDMISQIPEQSQVSYGCGSPVDECNFKGGETLVDLGSGRGAECFIAAEKVGAKGKVIGIDMLDSMLEIARNSGKEVIKRLGYSNCTFIKGYLENLPVENSSTDIVISNCVINLSPDKRKTFKEIFRILKPGGNVFVSDIVSETEIPHEIKYNEKLRGECIGGAMKEDHLMATLKDLGFQEISIRKRYIYREIKGFPFYSLTWSAKKPGEKKNFTVIYRGPHAGIITEDGKLLKKGGISTISLSSDTIFDDSFFVLDSNGNVTNIDQKISCGCNIPPPVVSTDSSTTNSDKTDGTSETERNMADCMVCNAPLVYFENDRESKCQYCGNTFFANACCENGHFVCDSCHRGDASQIIESICLGTNESDPIKLFNMVRSHPSIPLHGPEHHALVPAVLVTAYKNIGGKVTEKDIKSAILRGESIPGGACGFMGICGGTTGVGIAFSLIRKANPLASSERRIVQKVTAMVGEELSGFTAARCCHRDCLVAIEKAIELSGRWLEIPLTTSEKPICTQFSLNRECIGKRCPYWPANN